ncbi:MAG: amino acid ABC transporter substrate-binding protein [Pseudomonadota bacterium]
MRKWSTSLFLILTFFLSSALAADTKLIYPADEDEGDTRVNDLKEILQMALKKTEPEFGPFELRPSTLKMNRLRYLSELERGRTINIAWSSTSEEMEHRFLPIRIPLRKGILGYRIALIAREKQALIDQVKSIEDLKKLTVGQGLGWLDVQLYEANGIKVEQAKYGNLFKMTAYKRFDLFPRGINEIFSEYVLHSKENPNLAIEKNLLIYYPWPYYFFFNKNDAALRTRIELGLRKMIKDGSFDTIFIKYNGEAIKQANLNGRRLIQINNYLLPKETPLDDATLWFHPKKK